MDYSLHINKNVGDFVFKKYKYSFSRFFIHIDENERNGRAWFQNTDFAGRYSIV